MSLANSQKVCLDYGENGRFVCRVESERLRATRPAPQPTEHLRDKVDRALRQPIDFPSLEQTVIPGDRVVLALDRWTPHAPTLIAATWNVLSKRDVSPDYVTVVQPASLGNSQLPDPRSDLPAAVRNRVRWKLHDPEMRSDCTYLATTASGMRLYLSREVVDADVVISVGQIAFDPLLGYRGTNSVFYPGLSLTDALLRSHGQGHSELGPDDIRPLRQMIDEVGWLLGNQFTIQVIASRAGGVFQVLAGVSDAVFERGKLLLAEQWTIELDSRPDLVVVAVDRDACGHGWEQVGTALATAQNLVSKGGRIVVLSQLDAECEAGLEAVRDCHDPADVLATLRQEVPPDLICATQIVHAVRWADVYLLSRLDTNLVDDLFMTPLADEREVTRLLGQAESCVLLDSAQHTYGRIVSR